MNINDFLSLGNVIHGLHASDKAALLRDLARHAAKALDISVDRIASELLKREELGSTGTGGGVAIPHARLLEVKKPFGMLAHLDKAIAFSSIDGQPVDVVFLLLLPLAPAGEQLTALASVARKLRNSNSINFLRQAVNRAELYAEMTRELRK